MTLPVNKYCLGSSQGIIKIKPDKWYNRPLPHAVARAVTINRRAIAHTKYRL